MFLRAAICPRVALWQPMICIIYTFFVGYWVGYLGSDYLIILSFSRLLSKVSLYYAGMPVCPMSVSWLSGDYFIHVWDEREGMQNREMLLTSEPSQINKTPTTLHNALCSYIFLSSNRLLLNKKKEKNIYKKIYKYCSIILK